MTLFSDPLMITTAPDQILVGLGLLFAFAAMSLFCLAVEQGHYPGFRRRLHGLPRRVVRRRALRRHWLRPAVGNEWLALSA